jgi:hypothetical protein
VQTLIVVSVLNLVSRIHLEMCMLRPTDL